MPWGCFIPGWAANNARPSLPSRAKFWVTEPRSGMAWEALLAEYIQAPTWPSEWGGVFPCPHWGPLRTLTISVNGKRDIGGDNFIVADLAVLGGAVLIDGLHL